MRHPAVDGDHEVVDQSPITTDRLRPNPAREPPSRSATERPGMYRAAAATKARRLAAIRISARPTRQYLRPTRQVPGHVSDSHASWAFHRSNE